MKAHIGIAAVAATLLLAGCGTSPSDRALSGGGIGAAGGALVGSLVGAPFAGALIGGGAGAATGAATNSSDVNLGKPVWKR
jgi:hypothetical protein